MPTFLEALTGNESKLDKQQFYNLAASGTKADSKTKSVSKKEERVSKEELELVFLTDSFIFNAVNVAVQVIMSAGYEITAKKVAVRKFFEKFIDELGDVGSDSTWEEILTRIFQDNYIYGGSWDELVWNLGDTKPVDIKTLSPREMDFARNGNGNIILDQNEKPVGYVQTIPYGVDKDGVGDIAPESVALNDNQIFVQAKRIAYIPLYTYGSGFEGIGKVEPGYKATIWKLNLLKAGAESTSRRGFSPVIAKVGNDNIHPTPQMTANILEKLKTLDYSKYMAIPNYVELTTLDVKSIDTYEEFLKYLTAMQSAALGVPIPFVTGLGEETNRATLGTQLEIFELSLNTIANRICRKIEKYIFKPIAEANGFDEVPKLEWGPVITYKEKTKERQDVISSREKADKEDEEKDKKDEDMDEKEEKLEMTDSGSNSGNPMVSGRQIQGVSQKKKIKSPKKKKI